MSTATNIGNIYLFINYKIKIFSNDHDIIGDFKSILNDDVERDLPKSKVSIVGILGQKHTLDSC